MPQVKLPLSGDVTQFMVPWTNFFSGAQFSAVTVNMGRSADPKFEQEVLEEVASYGRQLGRIGEALAVLIAHFRPETPLSDKEAKAISDLRRLLDDIAELKERPPRQC